jgi:hypothetical protein
VTDIARKIDVLFEPVLTTPEQYRKDLVSPLLHEIRKDGIKLA